MEFNLGKKYKKVKGNAARSIVASIIVTLQQLLIVTVLAALSIFIIAVVPFLWIVTVVLAFLCVLTISNIIARSVEKHRISNMKVFKSALIIQYLVVIHSFVVFLMFTVLGNYKEHLLPTEYNFNIITNIKNVMSEMTSGFTLGSVTIPAVVVIVFVIFLSLTLLSQMVILDYDGCLYIKSEDEVVSSGFAFSLMGVDEDVVVTYKYLRDLEIDDSGYIVEGYRYFDFYIYGDNEQYFYIETYTGVDKKGKIKKFNVEKSDVYVYDVSLFSETDEEVELNNLDIV